MADNVDSGLAPAPPDDGDPGLGGLVRLAATAWWHTTEYAVGTSIRVAERLVQAAIHPDQAGDLAGDVNRTVRTAARDLARLTGRDGLAPVSPEPAQQQNGVPAPTLRAKGEELLHKSRDVHYEEDAHPAYERLVESLAPDEARILRLLLLKGPQPSVDIRTGGPLGLITSRLLAPGLNMIGARAGLKYVDRAPSYLTNLHRLGLIWFSRETLRDPERYQVLEAQPEVLAAVHSVRAAKIVRRSIHLTPFGEDFCRAAFASDTQRHGPLPEHASPASRSDPQGPLPAA